METEFNFSQEVEDVLMYAMEIKKHASSLQTVDVESFQSKERIWEMANEIKNFAMRKLLRLEKNRKKVKAEELALQKEIFGMAKKN